MHKLLGLLVGAVLLVEAQQQYVSYANPALSIPYGPGLYRATILQPTQFYIQAVSSTGQNMTSGMSYWKCQMKAPNGGQGPKLTTTDFLNGTSMVSYTIAYSYPPVTGLYTLEIYGEVNGQKMAVRGSPYSVMVIELAPIDPLRCHTRVAPSVAQAGAVEQFTVVARDTNGNTLTAGSEEFVVSLTQGGYPVGAATITPKDDDGEYNIEFISTKSGTPLQVSVKTSPPGSPLQDIAGSPFTVYVQPGPLFPANCDAVGAGVVGGVAGQLLSFLLIEQDAWNNDRGITTANAQPTAYFTGSNTIVTFAKNKNGTWTGTYTLPKGDKYLTVKLDGIEISGSPFLVRSSSAGLGAGGAIGLGALAFAAAAGVFCFYRYRQATKAPEVPYLHSSVPGSAHTSYKSTARFDSGSDSEAY